MKGRSICDNAVIAMPAGGVTIVMLTLFLLGILATKVRT
jgi:hypothetical protein